MMANYTITKTWYEDIEDLVRTEDPFFYMENGREMVEVDVDEEEFLRISEDLGWL